MNRLGKKRRRQQQDQGDGDEEDNVGDSDDKPSHDPEEETAPQESMDHDPASDEVDKKPIVSAAEPSRKKPKQTMSSEQYTEVTHLLAWQLRHLEDTQEGFSGIKWGELLYWYLEQVCSLCLHVIWRVMCVCVCCVVLCCVMADQS